MNRIASALATACLLAASLAVTSPPAAEAAGCEGAGCTGRNPEVQGCGADARTVDSFVERSEVFAPLYIELRHSGTCRARWVRHTFDERDGCGGGARYRRLRITDFDANDNILAREILTHSPCDNFAFTAMVGRRAASKRTQFCFALAAEPGGPAYNMTCKSFPWP